MNLLNLLLRRQPVERQGESVTVDMNNARSRLKSALNDVDRLITEILDQNQQLRGQQNGKSKQRAVARNRPYRRSIP